MTAEVQTYLDATAKIIAYSEDGIAAVRVGRLPSTTARFICKTLDKEAGRARQIGRERRLDVASRKALEAVADNLSRLKGVAKTLR